MFSAKEQVSNLHILDESKNNLVLQQELHVQREQRRRRHKKKDREREFSEPQNGSRV